MPRKPELDFVTATVEAGAPAILDKDRLADPSQRVGSSSLSETVPAARQVYSASSHLDISLQYVSLFPRPWVCPCIDGMCGR